MQVSALSAVIGTYSSSTVLPMLMREKTREKRKAKAIKTLKTQGFTRVWDLGTDKLEFAISLQHGLKVKIKEDTLHNIQNEQYVKDYYNLHVKRLNRWWYSVFFEKKSES